MSRCIWEKEAKYPRLASGMVVQYFSDGENAYLLTHLSYYGSPRTICLNSYSTMPSDFGWPRGNEDIKRVWKSLDDYYKDKFNV